MVETGGRWRGLGVRLGVGEGRELYLNNNKIFLKVKKIEQKQKKKKGKGVPKCYITGELPYILVTADSWDTNGLTVFSIPNTGIFKLRQGGAFS